MNFTSQYLFRLKRRILDNFGNPIDTITYIDEPNSLFFYPPSLDYNIIETRRNLNTPVLRESKDLIQLKDEGFLVCSVEVNQRKKFFPKQREFYFICRIGQVPVGARVISKFEGNNQRGQHYILYDDANKMFKLMGQNAGPMGEGQWIQLENP